MAQSLAEALGLNTKADDKVSAAEERLLEELDHIIEPGIGIKEFFKRILESQAYRRSVFMRVATGTLPPAVECRIVDHVEGKPVDRVEFEDKTNSVDRLTLEELHERHSRTVMAMQKILQAKNAEPQH
jgi:hypothetical protein